MKSNYIKVLEAYGVSYKDLINTYNFHRELQGDEISILFFVETFIENWMDQNEIEDEPVGLQEVIEHMLEIYRNKI